MAIAKRIILSAGHGTGDPGGSGQGVSEYSQTKDMVNRTVKLLKADGQLSVVLVPHELTLDPAIRWVNARYKNLNDGIAVEVHKNDFTLPAHGLETWCGRTSASKALGTKLHTKLISITKLRDRGVKPSNTAPQGGLGWVDRTNTWALLPEMGFIDTDPLDNSLYAKALFTGILNMWGLKPKVVSPPTPTPTPTPKYAKQEDLVALEKRVKILEDHYKQFKAFEQEVRDL